MNKLVKVTPKQKRILQDMAGFILFGINNGMTFGQVLGNLGHDVGGFLNKEKLFSPRTKGFRMTSLQKQ